MEKENDKDTIVNSSREETPVKIKKHKKEKKSSILNNIIIII